MDEWLLTLDEVKRSFRSWYGLYSEMELDTPAVAIVIDKMIETAGSLTDFAYISRTKINEVQRFKIIEQIESLCGTDIRQWIEVSSFADVGKFVVDRAIEVIEMTELSAFRANLASLNEIEFFPIDPRVAKSWILRSCSFAKTPEDVLELYFQQLRHCPTDRSSMWAAGMIENFLPMQKGMVEKEFKFNELINIRNKIRDTSDPLRKRVTSMILSMALTEEQWKRV